MSVHWQYVGPTPSLEMLWYLCYRLKKVYGQTDTNQNIRVLGLPMGPKKEDKLTANKIVSSWFEGEGAQKTELKKQKKNRSNNRSISITGCRSKDLNNRRNTSLCLLYVS